MKQKKTASEETRITQKVTVTVDRTYHDRTILIRENGDTLTSKSEEFADFFFAKDKDAQQFKPEWTAVEDGLPEVDELVIVIQDTTKTATSKPLMAQFDGEYFRRPYWKDNLNYVEWNVKWAHITHWQPLPSLPNPKQ